ncbi:UNVERIFIED_ORG: hypothetical protein ABID57_000665 [Arthrobacter sp. UYEF1]
MNELTLEKTEVTATAGPESPVAHPGQPRAASRLMSRVKNAALAFWNWKPLPEVLAITAVSLGILAIIGSGSELLQGPTATTAPNAAEWLSAISTFWGAIATALAAFLTAGALIIALVTFRRQVADRHRALVQEHQAQATAVSVLVNDVPNLPGSREVVVRNDSPLPIFQVRLVAVGSQGRTPMPGRPRVIPSRGEVPWKLPRQSAASADVEFKDAAGTKWFRTSDGVLRERDQARS